MTEISVRRHFVWESVDLEASFAALRDPRGRSLEKRALRLREQAEPLPGVAVHLTDLVPTQETVSLERVRELLADPLAVLRLGGRMLLIDGHHHAVAARLQGQLTTTAELVDLDALLA